MAARRARATATAPVAGAPALEARGLVKRFGPGPPALDGLSFHVEAGELYGLVGPDGAGKTTSIRVLTGLALPDAGEALVTGLPASGGADAVRSAIGYMPQRYSLYGDLSIDENIAFFGRLFGLTRAALAERREQLLGITRLLRFGGRRANDLSGGMYKKLALACALLHRPTVLVLDEPSNGVDPVSRRELWDLLYGFVAEGMAVLLATPYMDEAARCHRVGLLSRGRLLAEGAPDALTRGFPHPTLRVVGGLAGRAPGEPPLEDVLEARAEVLALSPHGDDLRVVVREDGADAFRAWASARGLAVEAVLPDFEDVYLGLLAAAPSAEGAR
ncbi:MAG: ABC transporter ATP-binding protein [Myxococcales bacterium]|nr:ABC transporter ATP-binding protein [Myxococcales bacterium]MCB9736524.1 ABC transporter ATP-binding protein [Deltaproteobacteria bacterium]